jgi:hypothetical protein
VTSSYSAEQELREIANRLRQEARELETAADVLRTLRECSQHKSEIQNAKRWAKGWMKP